MILYKYYSNLGYAFDDLHRKEVYLSTPENFNDGFEASLYDADLEQYITIDGLHILCLSPFHLNQSMWGVYANSEKGVCIGYEVPEHLVNSVRYSDKLITKASIDEVLKNAQIPQDRNLIVKNLNIRKKCALLKSCDWIHENEYRIILDDNDQELKCKRRCYYLELNAKVVYAGRKLDQSQTNFQNIMKECRDQSIQVHEIVRGINRRCLEVGNTIEYEEVTE